MKARNYTVHGEQTKLQDLQEEYSSLGRETRLEEGRLTVFALPQTKPTEKKKPKRIVRSYDDE